MMEILMTHRDEYHVVPVSVKCYRLCFQEHAQVFRVHNHESLEILVMREGVMDVLLGKQKFRLQPGDAVIVNPYVTHMAEFLPAMSTEVVYHCLMLEIPQLRLNLPGSLIDETLSALCLCQKRFVPFISENAWESAELSALIDRLRQLFEVSFCEKSLFLEGAMVSESYRLLTLLAHRIEDTPPEYRKNIDLDFICSVNDYMKAHYAQPITSLDACTELGFSRRHFSRLFQRCFGTTFTEYLREYRVGRAVAEYRGSTLMVYEVAAAVGFPDYCSFSRSFKRVIGVSPSKFFKK